MILSVIILLTIVIGSYATYSYISSTGTTTSNSDSDEVKIICPAGTSLLNTGGMSNITGCKCPEGQKYYNKKCVSELCPTGTSLTGLGGIASGYPGCACPDLKIYSNKSCISCPVDKPFNSFIKACVSCYSTSSVYNSGVPAGPTGCFCSLGMQYVNSVCTSCSTVILNSSFFSGLENWTSGNAYPTAVGQNTIKPVSGQINYIVLNNNWIVGGISTAGYIKQRLENFIIGKKYALFIRCSPLPDHWQPRLNVKIDNPDNTTLTSAEFDYSKFAGIAKNGAETASIILVVIFIPKNTIQTITIKNTGIGDAYRQIAIFQVHIANININTNTCGYPLFLNSSFQSPSISMDYKSVTTDLVGWSVNGKVEIIKGMSLPGLSQYLCLYGNSSISQEINYLEIGKTYIIYATVQAKPGTSIGHFVFETEETHLFDYWVNFSTFFTINNFGMFVAKKNKYIINFKNDSPDANSAVLLANVSISLF